MSPEQVAAVEAAVNARIDAALTVHSAVVPLAAARTIAALRAVFGETYPDPVRLVSVGAPVADLLAEPAAPAWESVSVELCGGTHLKNTSHAGRFAIVEEGSIAKGVRRITAVTRDAAIAAHGRAAELAQDVSNARALAGAPLAARAEALKKDLDAGAPLPAHARARLRDELAELGKRVIAEAKAAAAAAADAARAAALTHLAAAAAAGRRAAAIDAPALRGDMASAKTVFAACEKAHPDVAVLLVSSDGAGKLAAAAACPPAAIAAGLKAGEWVNAALAAVGGRGGGTDAAANGSSKEHDRAADVLKAADEFARSKGL